MIHLVILAMYAVQSITALVVFGVICIVAAFGWGIVEFIKEERRNMRL